MKRGMCIIWYVICTYVLWYINMWHLTFMNYVSIWQISDIRSYSIGRPWNFTVDVYTWDSMQQARSFSNGWTWSGQSCHMTDHSGQMALVRRKERLVKVVAYRLQYFIHYHVNRQCTTLQHLANFSIFKCKSSVCHTKRWYMKRDWNIWRTVLCSCIAKDTDNLHHS